MSASVETKNPAPVAAGTGSKGGKLRYTAGGVNGRRKGQKWPDGFVESLRSRLPDYLRALGIDLSPQGSRLIGHCPVHEDRTPSFAVFGRALEQAGCYPCDFRGSVFDVSVWLGRSTSFAEAVCEVAGVLGLEDSQAQQPPRPSRIQRRKRAGEDVTGEPVLSASQQEAIHRARLRFSDAFHAGDPIIEEIRGSLGLRRETLRHGAWGSCGLGIADGWLAYAYPHGLKWRNPKSDVQPRFRWLVGKAHRPWRAEWITAHTRRIIVTEGESDALALIEAGLEDSGDTVAVASSGTSFRSDWASLFSGKVAVLAFDQDDAGQTAARRVADLIAEFASEIRLVERGNG